MNLTSVVRKSQVVVERGDNMLKLFNNDDFILYSENGNVILAGVNTGVNNIYSITKPFPLTGNDLEYAKSIVKEHFNNSILELYLSTYTGDNEIYAKLTSPFWDLFVTSGSIDATLSIIDEALGFGFEFKVENGQIWCREIMNNL